MSRIHRTKVFRHLPGLEVKAVFSDCGKFRYLLKIKRKDAVQGKRVCAIMLNPSVASEEQADKSVQFLEKLVFEKPSPFFKDCSELWITNLFAYIQTHNFEGTPEEVGVENDQYLASAITEADIVLLAWGKTCPHTERQAKVIEILANYTGKQYFTTRSHPSRGRYDDFVIPWKR